LEFEIFKNDSFNVVYHDIKKLFLILNEVLHEENKIKIVQKSFYKSFFCDGIV